MVADLRRQGIRDERVLAAMDAIPRHLFIEDSLLYHNTYLAQAFPIGCLQTLSRPYTVAFQSEQLEIQPGMKVLEVGTGSGYQAAVLAALGAEVYSVERYKELHLSARLRLHRMGFGSVRCYHRDGYKGLAEEAPFDRIIVTAAAREIPEALLRQLKKGGWLLIPVGQKSQVMWRITRRSEQRFAREQLGEFQFVPFLPGKT